MVLEAQTAIALRYPLRKVEREIRQVDTKEDVITQGLLLLLEVV